jgi:thiamine-monophosphate kinase
MVKRSGARPGDVVLVSGTIGDGGLGLRAARGELHDLPRDQTDWLIDRYRLPQPRMALRESLRAHAAAAADVSDGLLADAGHIGEASGAGIEIRLEAIPLSPPAEAWLARQADRAAALAWLAVAGDDYEVVCTARPDQARALVEIAGREGLLLTPVGRVVEGAGITASYQGRPIAVPRTGWRHA